MARIWDRFLTDEDRAYQAAVGSRAPVGFGDRPLVLMIDNYAGVLSPPGASLEDRATGQRRGMGDVAYAALEQISTLLGDARGAGIPVVHVTGLHGGNMPGWYDSIHRGAGRGSLAAESPGMAERFAIVPQAAPIDGEVVLQKSAPSAFWGTPLAGLLTYLGVDTLIVGGESTSGCVRATVVDAASHRYRVIVVEECCYDRTQSSHAINLFDMDQKYADVLGVDVVLDWIGEWRVRSGESAEHEPLPSSTRAR